MRISPSGRIFSARDEKAVRKTVSGLLKILHPHGQWTHAELREYLEFAMEGRRRVKEQLKKLAAHDYAKTAFSYVERDTGREVWVEVPEQREELEAGATDAAERRGASATTPTTPMRLSPNSFPLARAVAWSSSRRPGSTWRRSSATRSSS